jgi:hypothetical protein
VYHNEEPNSPATNFPRLKWLDGQQILIIMRPSFEQYRPTSKLCTVEGALPAGEVTAVLSLDCRDLSKGYFILS